jgi:molybdenum cofactor cytidylyltransferase
MGSAKALLPYAGETFADRLIGVFSSVCYRVIVVLGHDGDTIRAGIRREAMFVFNPDYTRGQLTSLQCGLRAAGDADAAFFLPVDYPGIKAETVRALLDAWTGAESAAVPALQGHHGHPVLIGRALIDEILALPDNAMARDVIHRHAGDTTYVETDDPGILRDADYPSDLLALPQVIA